MCVPVGVHFWCPVLREGRCAESPHTGLSQRAFPQGETPAVSVVRERERERCKREREREGCNKCSPWNHVALICDVGALCVLMDIVGAVLSDGQLCGPSSRCKRKGTRTLRGSRSVSTWSKTSMCRCLRSRQKSCRWSRPAAKILEVIEVPQIDDFPMPRDATISPPDADGIEDYGSPDQSGDRTRPTSTSLSICQWCCGDGSLVFRLR